MGSFAENHSYSPDRKMDSVDHPVSTEMHLPVHSLSQLSFQVNAIELAILEVIGDKPDAMAR